MKKGTFLFLLVVSFVSFGQTSKIFAASFDGVTSTVSTSSAEINWKTDVISSNNYIYYGTSSGQYSQTSSLLCIDVPQVESYLDLTQATQNTIYTCKKLINLIPDTIYYYKIFSYYSITQNTFTGTNNYSSSSEFTLKTLPLILSTPNNIYPTAPTNLIATIATSSTDSSTTKNYVHLQWNNVSTSNTITIMKYSNGIQTEIPITLNTLSISSYSDYEVNPGASYNYKIRVCNGDLCSYSPNASINVPHVTLTESIPVKPAQPTIISLSTSTTSGSITEVITTLSWYPVSGADRYKILSSNINGTSTVTTNSSIVGRNLSPGTYTYSVMACVGDTNCSLSSYKSITIPQINSTIIATSTIIEPIIIFRPISPTNATANILPSYNNSSYVNISWLDKSSNEDYFKIIRTNAEQSKTNELNKDSQSYTDSGLSSGLYTYNIYACNTSGCSYPVTTSINIPDSPSKILSGTITFPDGKFVVGAKVTAYNLTKSVTTVTDTFGKYSLSLPGGTYTISVIQENAINKSWVVDNSSIVIYDTDKVINFTVKPLISTLKTIVVDESGNPISNIGINISNGDGVRISIQSTDINGNSSVLINPGTYIVNTSFSEILSYIPPETQTISINNSETKIITFVLKKKDTTNVFELRGITKFDDGLPTSAHISAWSDNGGTKSTYSSVNGEFSLLLASNDTWHISANKDKDGKSYETTEVLITKNSYTSPISLFFIKNDFESLPQTVSTKTVTTETVKVEVTDGAGILLPPNSTNSSGSIDVQVKPTTEAPSQKSAEVISTVYDITIKNSTGANVTTLSSEAKITLPYDEDELRAQGISVESIIPSYFDEKIGTWVSVPKFTIDKSKKMFTLYVQHLTRFALIASADTTAPSSPTNIVTDAITPTDVKITWNNPQNDFHHVKIYRSDKLGSYGDLVAAEVFANTFIDKTFSTVAKTYYYTVRAVDAAGNESNNNNQIASTLIGDKFASKNKSTSLALPPGQVSVGEIKRKLSLGSKGEDVTALQRALKIDGFYVTGPITGYYGKLTKNAVTRFQNYYKNELLIPNGYKTGTGIVGPATMKKINEILANNS